MHVCISEFLWTWLTMIVVYHICQGSKGGCSLQFVECPNDINSMIDAAKFADLTLLLIDGSYGFEMVS